MKNTYGLIAAFDTTPELYHACEKVRDAGFSDWDAITPFPVHGLDAAMGIRRSKVPRLSLMGGTSNLSVIRSGSAEQVRADVRAKKAAGIDIIGPECAVPLDAPYRNMVALTEEVKRGR